MRVPENKQFGWKAYSIAAIALAMLATPPLVAKDRDDKGGGGGRGNSAKAERSSRPDGNRGGGSNRANAPQVRSTPKAAEPRNVQPRTVQSRSVQSPSRDFSADIRQPKASKVEPRIAPQSPTSIQPRNPSEPRSSNQAQGQTRFYRGDDAADAARKAARDQQDRQQRDRDTQLKQAQQRNDFQRNDQSRSVQPQVDRARQDGRNFARDSIRDRDDRSDLDERDDASQRRDQVRQERPSLGAQFASRDGGIRVSDVTRDSAAGRVGFQQGDEVVSIGGNRVSSQAEIQAALRDHGRRYDRRDRDFDRDHDHNHRGVPVVVRRNGALQTLYWTPLALAIAGYAPYPYGYAPGYLSGGYPGGYYTDSYYDNHYYQASPPPAPVPSGAWLGVKLDLNHPDAARVRSVVQGSPAEAVGIEVGDAIWAINGETITSPEHLTSIVNQLAPGQTINISFGRNSAHETQLVLGDRRQSPYY